jgi:hypothetical protein
MAGTLFGLPLSVAVDLNGKPLIGNALYVYTAGSFTVPVTAYKDFGLTAGQEHPFPIPSDAFARLPIFWLADGSYAFRLVDGDGVVLASSLNVQALGASSGAGGGGSPVDPNALFQTGDVLWQDVVGTRSGFTRDNGRTVGSATSGATERASSDVAALYDFLWQKFSNTFCPVSGGRGGSSAADFAANKPIQLPDKRGYIAGGLDDMGNAAANRWAGVPVVLGDTVTGGSVLGENLHTLLVAELAALTFTSTVTDPGHLHTLHNNHSVPTTDIGGTIPYGGGSNAGSGTLSMDSATTGVTVATSSNAGGGAHNNAQKTVLGTFFRKL